MFAGALPRSLRDFAILLGHHHFEVRQHVVEVVVLRAFLGVARGALSARGSGFGTSAAAAGAFFSR